YKLLKWAIEIKNFEKMNDKPIEVNLTISPSILRLFNMSYTLLEGFIVDAFIHYVLTEKGYNLLHASCVAKDDRGIAFIARGGGGKTTLSLNLLRSGFRFVSDNFTILLSNSKVKGFVEPLNIFTYNLSE
ncbi:hypothetical protein, partial [Thermococcus sp. GR7]